MAGAPPLVAPLPEVDLPAIWYQPIDYALGEWGPALGATLYCQVWECDSVVGCGGLDPDAAPDAALGDDVRAPECSSPHGNEKTKRGRELTASN